MSRNKTRFPNLYINHLLNNLCVEEKIIRDRALFRYYILFNTNYY